MTDSPNLKLPEMESRQKRKHEVHNDALYRLDALVQLAVCDRDLATPPASPTAGQSWIVAAAPTGLWSGHANDVAAWQNNGWQFSTPQAGWLAYVADEGAPVVWTGAAWADFFATVRSLQNLTLLGVGTTATTTNPISAKLNNALWVAKTVAEGGDGNLRYKLSKENAAATSSLLFQDDFSGRAEIGLTGDDDFHFKVSADGATWFEALQLSRSNGGVKVAPTTAATSTTTGALTVAGGAGIAGSMYVGGGISCGALNMSSVLTVARNDPNCFVSISPQGGTSGNQWWFGATRSGTAINAAGNFFIWNQTAGKLILDIDGSAGHLLPGANNVQDIGSSSRRFATVYAQNALNTSDIRAKDKLSPLADALPRALALDVHSFDYYDGASVADGVVDRGAQMRRSLGVVAQQARALFPEIVFGDETRELLSVAESKIGVIALAGLQQLAAQVADRLDAIERRLSALEQR
jgi:hypothetical protein